MEAVSREIKDNKTEIKEKRREQQNKNRGP